MNETADEQETRPTLTGAHHTELGALTELADSDRDDCGTMLPDESCWAGAMANSFAPDTRTPEVHGLSHVTFVTSDIERAARLWTDGLGAREVYDSLGRNFSHAREKFFVLGGVWIAVMEGIPGSRSYRHVAFSVRSEDLPAFAVRLHALAAELGPARSRVEGEGQSLYFHDYDNNLIELHSGTLDERLRAYRQTAEAEGQAQGG